MLSDKLVEEVEKQARISPGSFEDGDILSFAYEAMISELCPLIISLREEYLVRYLDLPIVALQNAYAISDRALGQTLREVKIVKGSRVINLSRISEEEVQSNSPGTPSSFYLQGNNVILYPTPASSVDSLRLSYFISPNRLVDTAKCARVDAIDIETKTIICTVPSSWDTGNVFDLIKNGAGNEHKAIDLAASSVDANSITFIDALPANLSVGDYLSLAGESPLPQVPAVCMQLLIYLTMAKCLESLGDVAGLQAAQGKISRLETSVKTLLGNRIQGASKRFGR